MIPLANTGSLITNKKTVIIRHQINKLIISNVFKSIRISWPVLKKLIPLEIELIPDKCKEKITKSVDRPDWPSTIKGGYKVHPVPEPKSINKENTNNNKDPGKNQ